MQPSAWMRAPLDQKTRTRMELEMIDGQPEPIRMLFRDFAPQHVYEAIALFGKDDPTNLRRILTRNLKLIQEDVLAGKDPNYAQAPKPH